MAKNVVIKTDGTSNTYSGTKRIQTVDLDGGTCKWMPMNEAKLAVKTINKNGTYKAESDNYYGYSKVIVGVGGKVSGVKSDGKTYVVDVDDEGFLVETMVPTSIQIITPPLRTEYTEGAAIDLTGIVVKAYSSDNTEWGNISPDQLQTSPEVAGDESSVTVVWARVGDGQLLEASYNITVTAGEE